MIYFEECKFAILSGFFPVEWSARKGRNNPGWAKLNFVILMIGDNFTAKRTPAPRRDKILWQKLSELQIKKEE
jgi:hypothetical protein